MDMPRRFDQWLLLCSGPSVPAVIVYLILIMHWDFPLP
ncbi:hypothetical protein ADICYQ_5555 [Cyclobacterium qasimii M12-11B]|uniref:Uncharacterized protein n=1 Tax=Cyclobacterium qasimii M12-11B TaxID=641524 RepID=S7V631_9BACT|nr:hypothetical protein ADICYQ_5555 [Cyclobacterium qasimii M12-11B]